FISRAETIETPPTTTLFSCEGEQVATLAESDMSLAIEEGITPPELFTFKAADGVTDLYGVLHKPSHFDPNRRYPLVLSVYGGPLSKSIRARYRATNPDTEFGVCVVTIENRGTTGRGKAFESAAYLKLGDVDIADQVEGIKHLTQRAYIDGERVGVYGGSYGGYMSALALTKYPEVFHTAVAISAVIDWRQYDTIYTERFMRTPEENLEGYDNGSVLTYANQLEGNLLILHGMVDDNVHPTNIWQLSKVLQDEGKSFDMMLYPLTGHGSPKHGRNLRLEYLVRHLQGDRVYSSGQGGERAGGQ
ncbi:MAG: prolyl oligopeptidase family serine peptidase, partial [Planctomycetota bacterium]|nr:prolyl oligopeptidase family serine peptidase [Planctomycetota bacterium]